MDKNDSANKYNNFKLDCLKREVWKLMDYIESHRLPDNYNTWRELFGVIGYIYDRVDDERKEKIITEHDMMLYEIKCLENDINIFKDENVKLKAEIIELENKIDELEEENLELKHENFDLWEKM